jgi:hypothetical protein
MFGGEGVTARQAEAVVDNHPVQLLANGRTCGSAGYTACKTSKYGSGESAQRDADGASDGSDDCAGFSACCGGGNATGRASDDANGATNFPAVMLDLDAAGFAARACVGHEWNS